MTARKEKAGPRGPLAGRRCAGRVPARWRVEGADRPD